MNESGLSTGLGIAEGLNAASSTLMNVMLTKHKLQQDRQTFDTDTKIKKLQLQKLGNELAPERLKLETDLLNNQVKTQKSKFDYYETLTKKTMQETQQKISDYEKIIEQASQDPNADYNYSSKNGLSVKYGGRGKDQYQNDLNKAQTGELSWDELATKYPKKTAAINTAQQNLPDLRERTLQKNPQFKEGWGAPAYFSKNKAKLNGTTRTVIEAIRTPEDLQELVNDYKLDPEGFKAEGIDVKAILEAYGVSEEESLNGKQQEQMARPNFVPQDDWNKATDEQKADFLSKIK